jgi:hypothetical protein
LPLSILPWGGSKFVTVTWHSSSLDAMPSALAILLPLLALIIDRWKSLRAHPGFWISMAIIIGSIGYIVWAGATGELWLNHDGQYCRDADSSQANCRLDPLKVINVYLTMLGYTVWAIGPIPTLILFGWLGYRRWAPVIVQSGS